MTPTMLWLRAAAILFTIIGGLGQRTVVSRNANEIMNGLLPKHSEIFQQSNPMIREAIFDINPKYDHDPDRNNSHPFVFEIEESTFCPRTATKTIQSYEEYRKFVSSLLSFVTADDYGASYGSLEPNFTWSGSKEWEEKLALERQFEENNFEAKFVIMECHTDTVNISPFTMPIFTPNFVTAIDILDEAAKKPNSESSRTTLKSFFRIYGTHFARKTHLGSQIIFGILFPSRAANASEDEVRIECVHKSGLEALRTVKANDWMTLRFSRIAADWCKVEEKQSMVSVIGPLPGSRFDGWAQEALKNPRPIRYFAEKISSLFKKEWIANVLINHRHSNKELNGSALYDFFNRAEMVDVSGPEVQPPVKQTCVCPIGDVGLEVSSEIQDNEEYFNSTAENAGTTTTTPAPTTMTPAPTIVTSRSATGTPTTPASPSDYGGVVIIGGLRARTSGETLGIPDLPPFPGIVIYNTLSIVGSTVFSCGGNRRLYQNICHYLRADDTTWDNIPLPWPLNHHRAVTVQDKNIWFMKSPKLYTYDTAKDNNQFKEYSLEFTFTKSFCAVSNQSHVFIIGVGPGEDQVWVNRDPSKPTEWERVAHIPDKRGEDFACLWFNNKIFMTGGQRDQWRNEANVLNLRDMTIRRTRPLVYGRVGHQMAVLHGKPAVLGGSGNGLEGTDSIEVYESTTDSWKTLSYTLKEGRQRYGLVQYRS